MTETVPTYAAAPVPGAHAAWMDTAVRLLADLLAGSTMPPDWPPDRAWTPRYALPVAMRDRCAALLAAPVPSDPADELAVLRARVDALTSANEGLRNTIDRMNREALRTARGRT